MSFSTLAQETQQLHAILTVAELKRRLTVGTTIYLVRAPYPLRDGVSFPVARTVQQLRSKDVVFAPAPFSRNQPSYFDFPKASELSPTVNGFIIRDRHDSATGHGPAWELEYAWSL